MPWSRAAIGGLFHGFFGGMQVNWVEITVRTNTAGADMVSELLMRVGAKGTAIEDRNDAMLEEAGPLRWDVLDASVIEAMDEDVLVRAYLAEDAAVHERVSALKEALSQLSPDRLGFDAGTLAVSTGAVREEDWAENWKKYYKPFRAGRRLVVKPAWEPFDARPEDLVLEINPGMAFGNGTHETTAMCLALMEDIIRPGQTVLDVGTGSGILAIAAAKLGAGRVLAVDLDPVAVRVAAENIGRNGLSGSIEPRVGDLLEGIEGMADVVVANIIADAIILLSGAVKRHLAPGGVFLSSGIIRDREADVVSAVQGAGFEVKHVARRGEWVAIVCGA